MSIQADIIKLRDEVQSLRGRVAYLNGVISQFDGPFPRIFQAYTEDDITWQEWAVQSGEMKEFVDGRRVTTASSPGAIIDVGDTITLMEVMDFEAGVPVTRYVPIGGGGTLPTGQYQFMGYFMVSQNVAGWDFARSHGILPE